MIRLYFILHLLFVLSVNSWPAWSQESADSEARVPVLSTDFGEPAFPGGLHFSNDGSMIWINTLDAWNVDTGKKIIDSPFSDRRISSPVIDVADRSMLVAGRKSGNLLLWREDGQPKERELSQTGELTAARLLDQGESFALVFLDPPSVYFGHVDPDKNDSISPLPFKAYRCAISPDGNLLAIRQKRGVKIWDIKRTETRATLKHVHEPFSYAFSADSRLIATGSSNDNIVRIFDTKDGKLLAEMSGHGRGNIFLTSAVYSLAFSPDGKRLASGGHDGRVIVWDVEARQSIMQVQIDGPPIVCSVAFRPIHS